MQPPDGTALPPAGAIRASILQALILAITMAAAAGAATFAAEPAFLTTLLT
jgi:hypothetical protein